jgi:O-antigen/teichoic acid export membrane protein
MEEDLLKTGVDESGAGLYSRVVTGGGWVFLMNISQRLLELGRLVVLARLLTENDFGLMGIALLMIGILETFTETGFQVALIQKKDVTAAYLNSAWTLGVVRAVFLFAVLFLAAPYGAAFFGTQVAKPIIRVYGLIILMRGLTNIGQIYFRKELEFNKQFVYQLSGTLVDVLVAVFIALLYRTVWALVLGGVAGSAVRCIASYMIQPYRPRISFSWKEAGELWGFGKWILGSSALVFLLVHGDDIFVGRLLGAAALGFYQMAYRLSNMPATEISSVIAQVALPAYSKIQGNIPRLRDAYLKVLKFSAFLAFPVAGSIFVLAPDFTRIFLGERWLPMVPAMQVLALFGMLRAIGATTGAFFMAVGKPEITTKIKLAASILLFILIYPFTKWWGILGASIAVTAYILPAAILAVYKVLNIMKSDFKEPAKMVVLPLIATLVMIFTILAVKTYIFGNIGLTVFFCLIVWCIFIYLLIAHLFDKFLDYGSKELIQKQFASLLQKPNKQ